MSSISTSEIGDTMSQTSYATYAAPDDLGTWTVRVYREANGQHVHSAERCALSVGLDEAKRAIEADRREAGA